MMKQINTLGSLALGFEEAVAALDLFRAEDRKQAGSVDEERTRSP